MACLGGMRAGPGLLEGVRGPAKAESILQNQRANKLRSLNTLLYRCRGSVDGSQQRDMRQSLLIQRLEQRVSLCARRLQGEAAQQASTRSRTDEDARVRRGSP